MSKVVIDENLQGKDLYQFLKANKSALASQKKAMPKICDTFTSTPSLYNVKGKEAVKTAIGEIEPDATSIRVKVVANTAYFMDSQRDVLLPDCWAKSIKDGKGRLHLKDHTYKLDAEIGDVVNIYSQDVSLTELGVNRMGVTQCLIYESDIKKSYDEKAFNKYKAGKINQHSIGLQYVRLEMAINDDDEYYKEEFANWNKYIDKVINREEAEKAGYFWIVPEIKLIEVSAVLMGANELTPCLSVGGKENNQEQNENKGDGTLNEPGSPTPEEPQQQSFDVDAAIKQTKFNL